MSRYNYSCANECGDEDCGKCMKRGIIFECPPDCTDYEPNFPIEYKHKPKNAEREGESRSEQGEIVSENEKERIF